MAVYRTTFRIDAPSDVVWEVLADFGRWNEWNPSVPSIAGDLEVGSTVALTLVMPGRPSLNVEAQLLQVQPGRCLTWHGNVAADWLFAGDREFVIDADGDDAVRFTHVDHVRGALFPALRVFMGGALQRHHDSLNAALKQRAETLAGARGGGATR